MCEPQAITCVKTITSTIACEACPQVQAIRRLSQYRNDLVVFQGWVVVVVNAPSKNARDNENSGRVTFKNGTSGHRFPNDGNVEWSNWIEDDVRIVGLKVWDWLEKAGEIHVKREAETSQACENATLLKRTKQSIRCKSRDHLWREAVEVIFTLDETEKSVTETRVFLIMRQEDLWSLRGSAFRKVDESNKEKLKRSWDQALGTWWEHNLPAWF